MRGFGTGSTFFLKAIRIKMKKNKKERKKRCIICIKFKKSFSMILSCMGAFSVNREVKEIQNSVASTPYCCAFLAHASVSKLAPLLEYRCTGSLL